MVQDLAFRVDGSGLRGSGFGFKVWSATLNCES